MFGHKHEEPKGYLRSKLYLFAKKNVIIIFNN